MWPLGLQLAASILDAMQLASTSVVNGAANVAGSPFRSRGAAARRRAAKPSRTPSLRLPVRALPVDLQLATEYHSIDSYSYSYVLLRNRMDFRHQFVLNSVLHVSCLVAVQSCCAHCCLANYCFVYGELCSHRARRR